MNFSHPSLRSALFWEQNKAGWGWGAKLITNDAVVNADTALRSVSLK